MKAVLAALCLLWGQGAAEAACRQALALGLDVSGSVDAREYALQRDGLAAALAAPQVAAALLSAGPPVAVMVYEWSAPDDQRVLIPWQRITSDAALTDVIARLSQTTRTPAPTGTGLGAALAYGAGLFRNGPECTLRTLDISGDGKSIAGPEPDSAQVRSTLVGVTVNGLAIGSDDRGPQDTRAVDVAELSSYFRAHVIHGPEAFVQVAIGYADYEAAMTRKLLREIKVIVLGQTTPAASPTQTRTKPAVQTAKNAQAWASAAGR